MHEYNYNNTMIRGGIMSELWKQSILLASDYHFDTMVASASSEAGNKVCISLGFREVCSPSLPLFSPPPSSSLPPVIILLHHHHHHD